MVRDKGSIMRDNGYSTTTKKWDFAVCFDEKFWSWINFLAHFVIFENSVNFLSVAIKYLQK